MKTRSCGAVSPVPRDLAPEGVSYVCVAMPHLPPVQSSAMALCLLWAGSGPRVVGGPVWSCFGLELGQTTTGATVERACVVFFCSPWGRSPFEGVTWRPCCPPSRLHAHCHVHGATLDGLPLKASCWGQVCRTQRPGARCQQGLCLVCCRRGPGATLENQ